MWIKPLFDFAFMTFSTLNGAIIYKAYTILYWRRVETSDWDHKLFRKMFTELKKLSEKLSNLPIDFYTRRRIRPLLAIRSNAAFNDVCICFTFHIWRFHPLFIQSIVISRLVYRVCVVFGELHIGLFLSYMHPDVFSSLQVCQTLKSSFGGAGRWIA